MTNSGERLTKNERRAAAREKARELQAQRVRRERLTKGLTIGGIIVGAVAIIAIVGIIIANSIRPAGPGPENMASDGIVIGQDFVAETSAAVGAEDDIVPTEPREDVVQIVIYQDYLCPVCGSFETANAQTIEQLVSTGAATVEYHPVSILDRYAQGSKYSTRSAAFAGCVAEFAPDSFFEWNGLMFANQPSENTTGYTDDELIDMASQAGIDTSGEFSDCVHDGRFLSWAGAATERAIGPELPNTDGATIEGTPGVFVNGQKYDGGVDDAAGFQAFVTAAAGQQTGEATPEPEATDAPATEAPATETPAPSDEG